MGPTQPYSIETMLKNHRLPGEGFEEGAERLSRALADGSEHQRQLLDINMNRRFLFGGRIQAAAGSSKASTLFNCFVSGTIRDSFVEGEGSITHRLEQAAATMRLGGGIGYNFGTLRPRNARIESLGSHSSGPVSFMGIYNAMGLCIASAGDRRGAQMGVMPIWHPAILEFIKAKQTPGVLTGFNVSIAVTDDFMDALLADETWDLSWQGDVWRTVSARWLWDQIMESTWDHAEPGVLFIDTINRTNNLRYCEQIAATNPCGEQPLPPFGACLLGSLLMPQYLRHDRTGLQIDSEAISRDIPAIVRAMDNVTDLSNYPLPEQAQEARSKRRMGIGVTGMANTIEACGHPYGSSGYIEMQSTILRTIRDEAYRASVELAREKGAFELFQSDGYLGEGTHASTLPEDIQEDIARHGIRNSHLTSIAPTGSISFGLGDNCSSSIEPVFSYETRRRVIRPGRGEVEEVVSDWAYRELGVRGRRTQDVTPTEHLRVLAAAQTYTDSAVSKTINVDGSVDRDEFSEIYENAWVAGCKGCTTFRVDGMREGIMESLDQAEEGGEGSSGPVCEIINGVRSCE